MSCLPPVWEEQIHTVLHHLSCHSWIYSKQDVMQQTKAAAANFHCDKLKYFPQIFFRQQMVISLHSRENTWQHFLHEGYPYSLQSQSTKHTMQASSSAYEGNIVQL